MCSNVIMYVFSCTDFVFCSLRPEAGCSDAHRTDDVGGGDLGDHGHDVGESGALAPQLGRHHLPARPRSDFTLFNPGGVNFSNSREEDQLLDLGDK
jgi:hypothetical protein